MTVFEPHSSGRVRADRLRVGERLRAVGRVDRAERAAHRVGHGRPTRRPGSRSGCGSRTPCARSRTLPFTVGLRRMRAHRRGPVGRSAVATSSRSRDCSCRGRPGTATERTSPGDRGVRLGSSRHCPDTRGAGSGWRRRPPRVIVDVARDAPVAVDRAGRRRDHRVGHVGRRPRRERHRRLTDALLDLPRIRPRQVRIRGHGDRPRRRRRNSNKPDRGRRERHSPSSPTGYLQDPLPSCALWNVPSGLGGPVSRRFRQIAVRRALATMAIQLVRGAGPCQNG